MDLGMIKSIEECNQMISESNKDTVYLVEHGGQIYNPDVHAAMLKKSIKYTDALRRHLEMIKKWEGPYIEDDFNL